MPLLFDVAAHRYTLDGLVLPSVTEVLQGVGMVDASWFTEESRVRGQYVHAAVALDHEGALDEDTLDPALAPYVSAWRAFKRDADFRPFEWEQQVCDVQRGYAGTYDVVGQVGDNPLFPPTLLDIKTGEPQAWVAIQVAAYARVAKGAKWPTLRRASLWLRSDGTYRLNQHTSRDDEAVFLAALTLYKWMQANVC